MTNEHIHYNDTEQLYPLGEFSHFVVHDLPTYNNDDRTGSELLQRGEALLPSAAQHIAATLNNETRAAQILGDLGMYAAMLHRKGVNIAQSPQLIHHLLYLSRITGLPPRDNYYAYTELNPPGPAARTYTGRDEEYRMVEYNRSFTNQFRQIIADLNMIAVTEDWTTDTMQHISYDAGRRMEATADLMLLVRKTVSPQLFFDFRAFSKPIDFGAALWVNEQGDLTNFVHKNDTADANIAIIDAMLYGVNDKHMAYLQTQYPHFPLSRRNDINAIVGNKIALIERIQQEYSVQAIETVAQLAKVFHGLWRWRSLHNSAASTHLRVFGKGRNPNSDGFEFDERLNSLQVRSKKAFEIVRDKLYHNNVTFTTSS